MITPSLTQYDTPPRTECTPPPPVYWWGYGFLCPQKLVAYLKYMTTIGVLLGGEENETRRQMQEVLEFEIKLAKVCHLENDQ